MESLPDGWEAVTSVDGLYYWNTETGEVTWKMPKAPAKKTPPPPPPLLPNSPPASEGSGYDPFNYAEDFSQDDLTSLQPLPTCYENVVLLEEPSPQEDVDEKAIGENDLVDQDLTQSAQPQGVGNGEDDQTVPSPSLEQHQVS